MSEQETEVLHATDDDLRAAVKNAELRTGRTWAELAAIAATGNYPTVRDRLAWIAVADLGEYA